MSPESCFEHGSDTPPRAFVTTLWSVVLSAKHGEPGEVDGALEKLCHAYWWPLYAFVRRRGYEAHDAQDLTQEVFSRLLAKDFLRTLERNKGRFRSFLLAALEHFLANEWRNAHVQKRGGQFKIISLDDTTAEQHYQQVAASTQSPERLFEQQWAITLLEQADDPRNRARKAPQNNSSFFVTPPWLTVWKEWKAFVATKLSRR